MSNVANAGHDVVSLEEALERERTARRICAELNCFTDLQPTLSTVLRWIKELSGCEAVAIRLHDDGDYLYYTHNGFPDSFVQRETSLCTKDADGARIRSPDGHGYLLACMCGNVICGRFNPARPFFTEHGSFWTNSTTELLASTTEADRRARTRDRCHGEGYESVALIPLRPAGETLGLLQLNDKRKGRFTPERMSFLERVADSLAIGLAHLRAAQALREREEKHRQLFATVPDAIVVFDAETREFVDANDAVMELYGYTRAEFLDLKQDDITAQAEESDRTIEQMAAGALDRIPLHYHKKRDGTVFPVEISAGTFMLGDRRLVYEVVTDITERKQTEGKIVRAKEEWEHTFDAVPDLIAILDRQFRITRVNKAMADRLGLAPAECIGQTCYRAVHGTEEPPSFCPHAQLLKDGQRHEVEVYEEGLGGTFVVTASPLMDANGQVTGSVHVARDISERKRADEALRSSRERLRALSRRLVEAQEAERRRIARELHDEAGQALSAMAINVSTIQRQLPPECPPKAMERLADTSALIDHTLQHIRDLSQTLRPAMLDELGLVPAVRWHLSAFAERAGLKATFRAEDCEQRLPPDVETTIYRFVQEALTNAGRHSHATEVAVVVRRKGVSIAAEVKDDGRGFDAEQLAADAGGGLLGMRERAALADGSFQIESREGEGTRVAIEIPVAARQTETEKKSKKQLTDPDS